MAGPYDPTTDPWRQPGDPTYEPGGIRGSGSGWADQYNVTTRAVPGIPGALGVFVNGQYMGMVSADEFAPQGPSFAPPAYSTTRGGLAYQAQLDQRLAAQGDTAAMERLRAQAEEDRRLAAQGDRAAMERLRLSEAEAFKRELANAVAQGVISERDAMEAWRRSALGEAGAGARAEMGEFTARRGQSIGAVQDTFSRMGQMASTPSDFLRLGYNAQGIQPSGATPTDLTRERMRDFFGQQMEMAGQDPRSFADYFGEAREAVGVPGQAESFADMFNRARGQVGGFQFGGDVKKGDGSRAREAAITGEKGKELVVGDNMTVIPNLSPGEERMLKRGGVGGKQFGSTEPERGSGESVYDVPFLRRGHEQPAFSGGFRRASKGGVGEVTGLEAVNPLDFGLQGFNQLLPFQQQMMMAQFGENIVDPVSGESMRAGIDPQTAYEMIRRSSLTGRTPAISRWG